MKAVSEMSNFFIAYYEIAYLENFWVEAVVPKSFFRGEEAVQKV